VDREGLWFKVLASRYGDVRERVQEEGRDGSAWWREIVKIREGVGTEGGSWFDENIHMKIGNGVKTFFWSDCWVGRFLLGRGLEGCLIYLVLRI